jgi:hypothetical protein
LAIWIKNLNTYIPYILAVAILFTGIFSEEINKQVHTDVWLGFFKSYFYIIAKNL